METRIITARNIVDIIDNTVLALKSKRSGVELNAKVKQDIKEVLTFLKNINNQKFERFLFEKAFFIEEEPLKQLQDEMKNVKIQDKEMESILTLIDSEPLDGSKVSEIQHELIKVSIPLWNIINKRS